MKRFHLCAALLLSACFAHADEIFQVNISSTWTGCAGTCTQTMNVSFLWEPGTLNWNPDPQFLIGSLKPGTLQVSGSGFLGSVFTSSGLIFNDSPFPFTALVTPGGDEVNIYYVDRDVKGLLVWGCVTTECQQAFGRSEPSLGLRLFATQETVTRTPVPEPAIMVLLLCASPLVGYCFLGSARQQFKVWWS